MKTRYKQAIILFTAMVFCSFKTFAEGGIALGATRVIYPQSASQTSLPVSNSSSTQRFLVNSWVEDAQGRKVDSFVATPPLFVSEPNTENTLRIVYVGKALPNDRESLFYLNVKAIPSLDRSTVAGKNILQLAILSRIKLFVRPENLPLQESEVISKISINRSGNEIRITNPTPYYVTLVNIDVDGKKTESIMIAPKASSSLGITGNKITFQAINDYGALTKTQTISFK